MESSKRELAQKVSILYYEQDKSQSVIGEELEISRSYVSQLLNYARQTGIVKISINIDEYKLRMLRKEVDFKSLFPSLKSVYIMHSDSAQFTENNIGRFAASYVIEIINKSEKIGINLGVSIEKTIDCISSSDFVNGQNKSIVQIMGGFSSNIYVDSVHPNEIVKNLRDKLNCNCYYLNCPAIIEQSELASALLNESGIRQVVDLWQTLDAAIVGIGSINERSRLFGLFSKQMIDTISKSGACGELTNNFYNIKGEYLPLFDENKISIPYESFKKIKNKLVICFGEHKIASILGGLRAGLIDILITDSLTSDLVLEMAKKQSMSI